MPTWPCIPWTSAAWGRPAPTCSRGRRSFARIPWRCCGRRPRVCPRCSIWHPFRIPSWSPTRRKAVPPAGGPGGGLNNTVNPSMTNRNLLNMNPRNIVPTLPMGMGINDSALYMLADGTGGFVIHNTNDLLSGMEKIARDQDQYYILGYSPEDSPEGSCHALKVKVGRGGSSVRSRSGYCNVRVVDALAGKPAETELEGTAMGTVAGSHAG